MQTWQEEYIKELKDKGLGLNNVIRELKDEIKRADKRSYNGKLTETFNEARIIAIQNEIDFQNSKKFYQR